MAIKISNSTIIDDSRNIIGAGQANFTGIVTASSYSGSGSNLTGIVTNIASGGGVIASVSNGQASLVVNSLGSSVEQLGILTHPSAYSSRFLFGLGGVASDYDASTIIVNDFSTDSNRNIYIFDKSASGYDFVGVVTETYGHLTFQGSDSVMSDDGTIFAVSRRESNVSSSNQIVIWQRTGNTFSGIATITQASVGDGTDLEGFGASFDMSSDGTKFVIGSGANQVAGIGSTDYGTAYVIDRSGSTVTGIATLVGTASTQSSTSAFGVVAMSDDGSTILVGDPVGIHTVNGVDYGGIVYKFTRTGNTVTQVGIITGSRFSTTDRFGGGVEISGDGSRIFVADPNSNVVGAASSSGIVYVYDSNLNEIQQISPHPNTTTGGSNTDGLGFLVRFSDLNYSYGKLLQSSYDGKVLVIGDSDISNFYIYIYDISLNQYILNKEVDFSTGSSGTGWNVAVSGDGTRSFIPDINYLPTGGSAKGAVYYYQNNASNLLQSFGNNIGIGTANPTSKLQIDGNIDFVGNSIKIGYCAGASDDKSNNYNNFLGYYAGGSNTTGSNNNFFGLCAGFRNTTQSNSIAIGREAGYWNQGDNNIYLGECAGRSASRAACTTGSHNVAIGQSAGANITSGSFNNFLGACVGYANTSGSFNNFFGRYAGCQNTSGCFNNFFGNRAGFCNTTGGSNNFFGLCAGYSNITGGFNNFFGRYAGLCNGGGFNNFFGLGAGCLNTNGSNNNFFGQYAGRFNETGCFNNFFGSYAGYNNTTQSNSIAIGKDAGYWNQGSNNIYLGECAGRSASRAACTTGSDNFLVGFSAGSNVTSGVSNIFFGRLAGTANTSGSNNNFFGQYAGCTNSTGCYNNFFGYLAGWCNTTGCNNNYFGGRAGQGCFPHTGSNNNYFGYQSGWRNTSGSHNNYFGNGAGYANTSGSNNNFLGGNTGLGNTTGSYNNFLGSNAALCNTTGSYNNFLGYYAGRNNTTGSCNLFLGNYAGCSQTTGSNNVAIGYSVQLPITTGSNQLVIGAGNTAWISGNSSYNVGIGTTNPTAKIHIGAATISAAGNAPLKIGAGTTLTTPEVGAIEYDGSYLYQTPNSTSGRAYVPPVYSFRRTTDGSAIGNAIADFFTTPSSLSLEASSVYKITCFAYFTKTTAGTATWTQLFSSAPTIVDGVHYVTPVTGMTAATSATYTQIQQYFYEQGSATFAWNPSATNLTTAVNHFYRLDMTVLTNAATNWRLRLTQSAGTATPLIGSYYTIEKVGPSTGIYAS